VEHFVLVYNGCMALHNEIGKIGEEIACKYLKNKDYVVINRNYSQYYGEIDIVCTKGGKTYFIEVKTVTRDTLTGGNEVFKPEDRVNKSKITKLERAIGIYLSEKHWQEDWILKIITVKYDETTKKALVKIVDL